MTLGLGLNVDYGVGTVDVRSGGPDFVIGGPAAGLVGSIGYTF
jgi:hypothetical protein